MAIIAVVVFFGVLTGATLLILDSWQEKEVHLPLGVVPGMQGAVGEAVAVARPSGAGLARARVAPTGSATLVASTAPAGGVDGDSAPAPALAPAQAVAYEHPPASSAPPPESAPSQPASQPAPAPTPPTTEPAAGQVSLPVSQPAPEPTSPGRSGGGGTGGPISSGSGEGPGPEEERGASFQAAEGGEYALSFSLTVEPTAYFAPGVENVVARIGGDAASQTDFALQLWDDGNGDRGLWVSGDAAGGERFLAPLDDGIEHEVVVEFLAAGEGDGFYLVFVDGHPVDAAGGVDMIETGSGEATVDVGLSREGEAVDEPTDVHLDSAELVPLEPALP